MRFTSILFKKTMPRMIVNKKFSPAIKRAMFTAAAIFALTQCSQDDDFINPATTKVSTTQTAADLQTVSVSSLTVSGTNTAFTTVSDCKSCTYIVAADEQLIDGKKFKAGDIICLNKGIKYGNIEFVNIEGSTEKPVVIATVGETAASPVTESGSQLDPY
jgi:hypothetical protein